MTLAKPLETSLLSSVEREGSRSSTPGGAGDAVWLGIALSSDSDLHFTPQAISFLSIFFQLLSGILKYVI